MGGKRDPFKLSFWCIVMDFGSVAVHEQFEELRRRATTPVVGVISDEYGCRCFRASPSVTLTNEDYRDQTADSNERSRQFSFRRLVPAGRYSVTATWSKVSRNSNASCRWLWEKQQV